MTDNILLKVSGDKSVMRVDEQLIEKKVVSRLYERVCTFARLHQRHTYLRLDYVYVRGAICLTFDPVRHVSS